MSDSPPEGPSGPPVPPPSARSGCLTALMVVGGIIMLVPGLCALGFGADGLFSSQHYESGMTPFIVVGLLVGVGGIMLIRAAIRGRRA